VDEVKSLPLNDDEDSGSPKIRPSLEGKIREPRELDANDSGDAAAKEEPAEDEPPTRKHQAIAKTPPKKDVKR
jgi:hypothetical protein